MIVCVVSWPLKALKALCHCASRKLAQQHSNNKVYCVGGRLGVHLFECVHCDVYGCMCVELVYLCKKHLCVSMYTSMSMFLCFFLFLLLLCCGCVSTVNLCVFVSVSVWMCVSVSVSVWTCLCVSICLPECVFPGLKCQLSTVILCGFCSVRLRGKQTVLIYHRSADGQRYESVHKIRQTSILPHTAYTQSESEQCTSL